MFIFGILATWKCDFCSLDNKSCEVKDCGCICVGIRYIYKDQLFLTLIISKKVIFKKVFIFIYTVYSVWPMLFPQYCLGLSDFKTCSAEIDLIMGVLLNLAQDIFRRFFWIVLRIIKRIGIQTQLSQYS